MSGGSKSQVVGHRYYFGIHMGIGRGPVDALHEVRVGDRTAWQGNMAANATINIDAYNLFGGEDKEGGVQGPLELMFGEETQLPSAGLSAMLGSGLSGFRRMFTVFFNGLVSMNNPYPKQWKFRFGRILKGWDGEVFQPTLARIKLQETFTESTFINTPLITNLDSIGSIFSHIDAQSGGLGDAYVFDDGALRMLPSPDLPGNFLTFAYHGVSTGGEIDLNPAYARVKVSVNLVGIIPGSEPDWEGLPSLNSPKATIIDSTFTFYDAGSAQQLQCGFHWIWWDGEWQLIAHAISAVGGVVTETWQTLGPVNTGNYSLLVRNDINQVHYLIDGVMVFAASYPAGVTTIRRVRSSFRNSFTNRSLRINTHRIETETPSVEDTIYSMNGAHIIFECLTNREWGRGLSRSKIDETSFTVAAQRLYDEGFGLCIKWTRKDAVSSFIQLVLNHIGASLYQSRLTGLMTLKLIRDDYDLEDLPVYTTENGLLEVKPSGIGSAAAAVNAITVKWHDPMTDEDRTVAVKNTASILRSNGAVNSTTNDYIGLPTPELALRVAQRDLRVSSTNLRRFTVVADRTLDHLHPGDVFALRDDKRGVPRMAVRIGKANYGTLTSGRITFEVVQDVFSLPERSFVADVPKTYTPPDTRPCSDVQRAFEVPYFLLARRMSPADFAYLKEDGGYFAAVAAKGKPINQGFKIAVRNGAPTIEDNPPDSSYVCTP